MKKNIGCIKQFILVNNNLIEDISCSKGFLERKLSEKPDIERELFVIMPVPHKLIVKIGDMIERQDGPQDCEVCAG